MFKIVIGQIDVDGGTCPVAAIFLNSIPVSHADVANLFSIDATHAGFATQMDDAQFISVYGASISLNKSISLIDRVELNNTLKQNAFIQIPYHAFSSRFNVWLSVPYENVESMVSTYDNSVVLDFAAFIDASQKHFKQFFN